MERDHYVKRNKPNSGQGSYVFSSMGKLERKKKKRCVCMAGGESYENERSEEDSDGGRRRRGKGEYCHIVYMC